MDDADEIEDIVGRVTYTDSQKSIPTTLASSRVYSSDFTDSSEDRNNSSGKDTYVIEWDSEDSEKTFPMCDTCSTVVVNDSHMKSVALNVSLQCATSNIMTRSTTTSLQRCSILAQETFTQTSKTIIELAEKEGMIKAPNHNSLQTQTSLMSITENKTVEYRIEVSSTPSSFSKSEFVADMQKDPKYINVTCNKIPPPDSIDESSSKFPTSESVSEENVNIDDCRSGSSSDQVIRIINDGSKETVITDERDGQNSPELDELSLLGSDIEEDSLSNSLRQRTGNPSAYGDIKDLRKRLASSEDLQLGNGQIFDVSDIRCYGGTLTPLTEESNPRKDSRSSMEIAPTADNGGNANHNGNGELLFTSNAGLKVKIMKIGESKKEAFKLPPISQKNQSCPNSPQLLNSLFNKSINLSKAGTLPCLFEKSKDRWEIRSKNLASGESPQICDSRSGSPSRKGIQLPPIFTEVPKQNNVKFEVYKTKTNTSSIPDHDEISIKEEIKDLKMLTNKRLRSLSQSRKSSHRSYSPGSISSSDDRYSFDRGCEIICTDLLKRLHSSSWHELMDTLEEIPSSLDKYWRVISEWRITDLIRQVMVLIESARPQVARTACKSLATILRNTSYTKKPDFYEAIKSLLVKTGSYSRAVRRQANMALDEVICNVELTHAICALCVHGVGHKSGLVRCAAARLLVVSCALASGGRDLLRSRPATAAYARRHALRALSVMLDDKSADARKYAERLYSMLRPLSNFEAFYLTDVDVETATKQMKKYDLLLCAPPKEDR